MRTLRVTSTDGYLGWDPFRDGIECPHCGDSLQTVADERPHSRVHRDRHETTLLMQCYSAARFRRELRNYTLRDWLRMRRSPAYSRLPAYDTKRNYCPLRRVLVIRDDGPHAAGMLPLWGERLDAPPLQAPSAVSTS